MKAFKIFVPMDGLNGAVRMTYSGDVSLELKADTSWSRSSDIMADSHIRLHVGDIGISGPKELHQKIYLVSIQEVKLNEGEHPSDGFKRITLEAEEAEMRSAGMSNDMIRRLKNVS